MNRNNHTTDVIHSLISQTRARLPTGGYQLARRLAGESIDAMLRVGDNAEVLLAVHLDPLPTPTPMPLPMPANVANAGSPTPSMSGSTSAVINNSPVASGIESPKSRRSLTPSSSSSNLRVVSHSHPHHHPHHSHNHHSHAHLHNHTNHPLLHYHPLHQHTEYEVGIGMPTQEGGGEVPMTAEALHFQQQQQQHHHSSTPSVEHSLYDAESNFNPQFA